MKQSKKRRKKQIPRFKSEDSERNFWAHEDSADYVDWKKSVRATFPNLKPSTTTISLRLPESLLADLKVLANKRDVPYQSLLKVFLSEKIQEELSPKKSQAIR
jgi:predicted DNA binding CopG/RHH family protein